ncbi:MAG: Ig-like domain-containing protein [Treponema sp.]|jgi:uncharacterized protein YjdB|nr:Ig-like domain-containing protein [Treponema sp.]
MKKRFWQFAAPFTAVLAVISLAFAVAGCGGGGKTNVPVTEVTLSSNSKTVPNDDRGVFTLTAVVLPANATNTQVTWTMDEEGIVSLSSTTGASIEVFPLAKGFVNITATAGGISSAPCEVEVLNAADWKEVEGVTLDCKAEEELTEGRSLTITAILAPPDASDQAVTWSIVEGGGFIEIEPNGLEVTVTGKAAGTAVVKVTTDDGGHHAECTITVKPFLGTHVDSVSLSETSKNLTVGGSFTLTATVLPEDATTKTVKWSVSGDAGAVSLSDTTGSSVTVNAIAPGTAFVTVTTDDLHKTKTCDIVVTGGGPVAVESVGLSETSKNLIVGGSFDLTATVLPITADNKAVTWSVSPATGVVSLLGTGETITVNAVGEGNAVITVTTTDGDKTKTCAVKVAEFDVFYKYTLIEENASYGPGTHNMPSPVSDFYNFLFGEWYGGQKGFFRLHFETTSSGGDSSPGDVIGNVNGLASFKLPAGAGANFYVDVDVTDCVGGINQLQVYHSYTDGEIVKIEAYIESSIPPNYRPGKPYYDWDNDDVDGFTLTEFCLVYQGPDDWTGPNRLWIEEDKYPGVAASIFSANPGSFIRMKFRATTDTSQTRIITIMNGAGTSSYFYYLAPYPVKNEYGLWVIPPDFEVEEDTEIVLEIPLAAAIAAITSDGGYSDLTETGWAVLGLHKLFLKND